MSTVGAIIHKWKEHDLTKNWPRPGAPHKISDIGVKIIIRRVVQEPRTTCRELQKDLELAGTIVSKKTISNALNRHGLYARSPRKTPLLKKKHGTGQMRPKCHSLDVLIHTMFGGEMAAHHPNNTRPTVKFGVGNILM